MAETYELNAIRIESPEIHILESRLSNILRNNGVSHQIITLNTDFLRLSYIDEHFKSICQNSNLVVPDGVGITLLIRWKYKRKIERITGSNLFEVCLKLANVHSLKVALIGSKATTLTKLNELIKREWPNALIKSISPEMNFEDSREINLAVIEMMKRFEPDILMVALGCPRQEKWIHSNKDFIGAKINIGVGGVFDFISGTKKRAPEFIQKIGLEWIWRLSYEPKQLSNRYLLHDLPFFLKIFFKVLLKMES
ncbi:MAG: WecB/TagA/CpsF family glycosyltransferase [Bacteroidetes bacterium]|nr:WecB/TagA/CpsF family glycosyltransferase [Bacteroidota bacterium]